MADAIVKFEKVYANKSVKLLFGDRSTIKLGAQKNSVTGDFKVSVNWGDGNIEEITDINQVQHMYGTKGAKTIIVTGGWGSDGTNRYLSFPKCKTLRLNNTYIAPFAKQTLTIKDGYLCIKFKGDYIGLSSENIIRVAKKQKNKFVNKTGEQITVNGTTIANNATSPLITMPNSVPDSGNHPKITGTGFSDVTLTVENNYNADGTGLNKSNKFKTMITSIHRLSGYPYAPKKYTINKVDGSGNPVMTTGSNPTQVTQRVKLVPGNKLAKEITVNGNFKLHGTGDFAGFDKLTSLKYDPNVGGGSNVGNIKTYDAMQVANFEYTFAGCLALQGSSNLLKKIQCRPIKLIGTFSGMSSNLNMDAGKPYLRPPIFKGNFSKVTTIDYMVESSNFDVDISAWNFSENKIKSAIGFAQNSNYRKDISSLSSKFTEDAVTTNIFEGAESIPEASKQALDDTYSESQPSDETDTGSGSSSASGSSSSTGEGEVPPVDSDSFTIDGNNHEGNEEGTTTWYKRPTISWTHENLYDGIDFFNISIVNSSNTEVDSKSSVSLDSYKLEVDLNAGSYVAKVTAVDSGGNLSEEVEFEFEVSDSAPSETPVITKGTAMWVSGSNKTADFSPVFSLSGANYNDEYAISTDGGATYPTEYNQSNADGIRPTFSTLGQHTIHVKLIRGDNLGSKTATITFNIVYDADTIAVYNNGSEQDISGLATGSHTWNVSTICGTGSSSFVTTHSSSGKVQIVYTTSNSIAFDQSTTQFKLNSTPIFKFNEHANSSVAIQDAIIPLNSKISIDTVERNESCLNPDNFGNPFTPGGKLTKIVLTISS